ncbi:MULTISPECIES: phosphoribosylaminoimidazolesuccinocarboxamide synthase [Carboxydocella]|uniref:Phosphoribosylaminoimidazole-succinocarboxamide synthase n=2 Tax=Carboxydocella TaxID=178898 RepID=A0A1T4QAD6_9FIRM|nr:MULTISPECIES: phosphoribosylaminoimidazolesuccinocarboxamide synthase [Carboxydocella]AVX19359.1 phosphoribosylaminoimidazole-succinocarboxamide synthase [Carboxydocella thermautotrophica]AVX29773.1 phosphoribosylaminoimidazole-succinocarboxamide synthase [Carboxydocella thermautotrophica]SKA00586.1 phosphoribosylaminoimidazole-succinocarboxamide synthase [Carboxydocella sporoproducens DSM 16521]GAW29155.1 phosphoribosylaminoimidazolesuccinocarboxamide synthase [Carboxydocella sp. ULO1]GAW3
MQKGEFLYEGKAKKIYATDQPGLVWIEYKDDATAFNGLKKGTISGKGELNNKISAYFFQLLAQKGIESHFVQLVSDNEQIVKKVEIVPLEVVVRNIAAGSLAKRLGLEEGTAMQQPVVELYYKNDELGDPLINYYHALALGLATREEMLYMEEMGLKINAILQEYLRDKEIILVDFKLEFGRVDGKIILADEISPDTCRFWDAETREKLDKDRFRRDLGGVEEAYQEVYRRLTGN